MANTLTEEEVKQRRRKTEEAKAQETTTENNDTSESSSYLKFSDIASDKDIIVDLETEGRFDIPKRIQLKPFTGRDIHDIALTKQEKILSTLVQLLNNCIISEPSFNVQDMLIQEFMELMIGIKMNYNREHEHRWLCDCQSKFPEEDQKVCTSTIDLSTIKYKNISDADKIFRENIRPLLEAYSQEDFIKWYQSSFGNELSKEHIEKMTLDEALDRLHIEEPIIFNTANHTYKFRFNRVKDLIQAQKEAENKFAGAFKQLQNKQYKDSLNIGIVDFKLQKERETEELREKQGKYFISVIYALRITEMDGKKIETIKQALEAYDSIDNRDSQDLEIYMEELQFGVYDTRDFVCEFCGETKQRLLQQSLDVLELLPINSSSTRKLSNNSRVTISFGVRV